VSAAPALAALAAQLALAPLLLGLIVRTKSFFAGRKGPPVTQPYRDMAKLLKKGAVFSRTTTWLFAAGPVVSLAALLTAALLVPSGKVPALLSFSGDFLLLAYLLAAARFFTVAAALDTGSSFEGMGGSREAQFSALAEPALLVCMAVLARATGSLSLSSIFPALGASWMQAGPELALVAAALVVVLLAENARIPVDDPATHLELTMIHEVMVLDHSGPDLAMIEYGRALKLWVLGALVAGVVLPSMPWGPWADLGAFLLAQAALAVAVGAVESSMARLRLVRVPQLLVGAGVLACLSLILMVG
jgi:formate hydrogenlyase subunit 4